MGVSSLNYWLLISLILFAVGGIFSSQRQLQMFQQNSYFPSRYIKWIKTASSVKTAYCAMFFIITAALSIVKATKYLPIIAIIELILRIFNYRSNSKKSIKKLVYTARIKRLICTFAIVYIALICNSFIAIRTFFRVFGFVL